MKEVHIGEKLTEESVSQMEQVFKEFKKNGGWGDYNDMEFSINGEEYWIYRCIIKPNRHIGFISNKEQYEEYVNQQHTIYRPRGWCQFNSGNISNTRFELGDKRKKITDTATRFIKNFIMVKEIRRESA